MWSWLHKTRLKSASSLDSISSVKCVCCAEARSNASFDERFHTLTVSCWGETPPRVHCMKEFANISGPVYTRCKASLQSPWQRRILSAWTVCAHLPITQETCSLTEKWLLLWFPVYLSNRHGVGLCLRKDYVTEFGAAACCPQRQFRMTFWD